MSDLLGVLGLTWWQAALAVVAGFAISVWLHRPALLRMRHGLKCLCGSPSCPNPAPGGDL